MQHSINYRTQLSKAFTLIELAISFVIIGLLVSGILGGRDLIEQSKLKRVYKDVTDFKTALYTFQLKYDGMPGDLTNAEVIWPNCDSPPSNCNGNGDGYIASGNESQRAWQQLAASGIISGSYTGEGSWDPGINAPPGPFDGTAYKIQTNSSTIEIEFNGMDPTCGFCSALTPLQAYSLDKIYDDGYATGDISASDGRDDSSCSSWVSAGVYEYNVTEDSLQCRLQFYFSN